MCVQFYDPMTFNTCLVYESVLRFSQRLTRRCFRRLRKVMKRCKVPRNSGGLRAAALWKAGSHIACHLIRLVPYTNNTNRTVREGEAAAMKFFLGAGVGSGLVRLQHFVRPLRYSL